MENILYRNDRTVICPKYKNPKEHRHLAKHIIISTEEMKCTLNGEIVISKSLIIQSNVKHSIIRDMDAVMLVFLIDDTSDLAKLIDDTCLRKKSFTKLDTDLEQDLIEYILDKGKLALIDDYLMKRLGYEKITHKSYDERIVFALDFIESSKVIEKDIYERMAKKVYLSKSRFLHLFKEEMGIDLKSYLFIKKLEKVCENVISKKKGITEAAIETGFSSSSHFADACLKAFGISLSEFLKAQEIAL